MLLFAVTRLLWRCRSCSSASRSCSRWWTRSPAVPCGTARRSASRTTRGW